MKWYRVSNKEHKCCLYAKSRSHAVSMFHDRYLGSSVRGRAVAIKVEELPDGKMTLEECPVGLFRWHGVLVLKTEYRDACGRCECYTVDGGERFWGDGSFNLNQLIVQPVRLPHV